MVKFYPREGSPCTGFHDRHKFPSCNNQLLIFGLTAFELYHTRKHIRPTWEQKLKSYQFIFKNKFNKYPKPGQVCELAAELQLQNYNDHVDAAVCECIAGLLKALQGNLEKKGLIFTTANGARPNIVVFPKKLLEECLASTWDGTFRALSMYCSSEDGAPPSNFVTARASPDFIASNAPEARRLKRDLFSYDGLESPHHSLRSIPAAAIPVSDQMSATRTAPSAAMTSPHTRGNPLNAVQQHDMQSVFDRVPAKFDGLETRQYKFEGNIETKFSELCVQMRTLQDQVQRLQIALNNISSDSVTIDPTSEELSMRQFVPVEEEASQELERSRTEPTMDGSAEVEATRRFSEEVRTS